MAIESYVPRTDPYTLPAGFAETRTPEGGTAYSYKGNTYVPDANGFKLFGAPQAPSQSLTNAANNTPSAVVTSAPARTAVNTAVQGFTQELAKTNPQGAPQEGQQYIFKNGQLQLAPTPGNFPTTSAKNANGEIINPTPDDISRFNAAFTTERPSQSQPSGEDQTSSDPEWDKFVATQAANQEAARQSLQTFQDQVTAIRTKLTTSNQGLIDSITQSFARDIENTKRINDATLAGLTQSGIRGGRSRYEMEAEDSGLANEMREGQRRLSDLAAKRDSLIAQTELAQSEEDWKLFYQSWTEAKEATKEMNQSVTDMYKIRMEKEKIAAQAVETKMANLKTMTDLNAKTVDSIGYLALNSLTGNEAQDIDTIKSLASQYGVDPNMLMSKVQELDTQNEEKFTGPVGEYNFYAQQTRAAGKAPLDFQTWRFTKPSETSVTIDEEGNRSVRTTSFGIPGQTPAPGTSTAGGGLTSSGKTGPTSTPDAQLYAGLSTKTATAVRAKVAAFKTEPIVQNFAIIQEGRNFASSIADATKNPADDQALIYALAKALDPGSVVREGEYATAQKYAQSWVKAYGKGVEQAIAGTGFLSQEARKNIKRTIETKFSSSQKSYDNLYNQYNGGINNLTGRSDGDRFLIDYAIHNISSPNTPNVTPAGVTVNGKFYAVGSTVTNAKGQKGKVNANGTITIIK
jgi:hypothetical protein